MPPRWPSSATPASQAPRWGIATLKVSCDQASLPAPTAIASVHTAAINFVLVIIAPPASLPANSPIQKIEDFKGKTVAYSLTGSSSHAALLALIAQYKLTAKPTSTGNIASTITQTMTGQVDVGFGAAPFGLDLADEGKIRIIATGNDVASLRTRTVRVNLTNLNTLQNRRDAVTRFNRAYQDTVAWMYSDPAALKIYAEYSNLPEKIVLRVRDLIPQQSLATDRVEGIDQIMADAVAGKFIPAPLTSEQVKELVQIPK